MPKKTRRKVLYALSTLLSALSSPGAYAKIPPTAFKGVTKCLKEKKEHFSPTLGEAALDSGLIYNLRFYGNFTAAKSAEGIRQYQNDTSEDSLWNMVKILFPSTGGQLSTEANHPMAFGRLMNTSEAASLLLNFVNNVRDGKLNEALENELKDDLFKSMTGKTRVESLEKARDALEEKLGVIRLEGRQSSLGNIKSKLLAAIQGIENPSKKETKIKLDNKIREDIIKTFQEGMAKENANNKKIIHKLEAMRKQAQDEIDQFYKEKIDKIKRTNEATLDDSGIIKIRSLEQEWEALKQALNAIQFEKLESPLKQAPSRIVDVTDKQKITIQEENETIRKRIRNIFQDGVKEEALEQNTKQLKQRLWMPSKIFMKIRLRTLNKLLIKASLSL